MAAANFDDIIGDLGPQSDTSFDDIIGDLGPTQKKPQPRLAAMQDPILPGEIQAARTTPLSQLPEPPWQDKVVAGAVGGIQSLDALVGNKLARAENWIADNISPDVASLIARSRTPDAGAPPEAYIAQRQNVEQQLHGLDPQNSLPTQAGRVAGELAYATPLMHAAGAIVPPVAGPEAATWARTAEQSIRNGAMFGAQSAMMSEPGQEVPAGIEGTALGSIMPLAGFLPRGTQNVGAGLLNAIPSAMRGDLAGAAVQGGLGAIFGTPDLRGPLRGPVEAKAMPPRRPPIELEAEIIDPPDPLALPAPPVRAELPPPPTPRQLPYTPEIPPGTLPPEGSVIEMTPEGQGIPRRMRPEDLYRGPIEDAPIGLEDAPPAEMAPEFNPWFEPPGSLPAELRPAPISTPNTRRFTPAGNPIGEALPPPYPDVPLYAEDALPPPLPIPQRQTLPVRPKRIEAERTGPLYHGTSPKAAERILSEGFGRSPENRVYDYSVAGPDSIYLTRSGPGKGFWLDTGKAGEGRAATYDSVLEAEVKEGTKIVPIRNIGDLNSVARKAGFKNAKEMMAELAVNDRAMNAGDDYSPNELRAMEAVNRLRDAGIDGLDIIKDPTVDWDTHTLGGSDQVIVFNPENVVAKKSVYSNPKRIEAAKSAPVAEVAPEAVQESPPPPLVEAQRGPEQTGIDQPITGNGEVSEPTAKNKEFNSPPAKTPRASTKIGVAGQSDTFEISTPDGSSVNGYVANADFPNEKSNPKRGELYFVKVPEQARGQGTGTSLAKDALNLMRANGAETVNISPTTKDGKRLIERLIRDGEIDPTPIRTSQSGKTEYFLNKKPGQNKKPAAVERPVIQEKGNANEELRQQDEASQQRPDQPAQGNGDRQNPGKEGEVTPAAKEPWQMTYDEWKANEARTVKAEYPDADESEINDTVDLNKANWFRGVESAAERERIPDEVLDSYLESAGKQVFDRTFRGNREQKGYLTPDVRKPSSLPEYVDKSKPWQRTWAEQRKNELRWMQRNIGPKEWASLRKSHKAEVQSALYADKPVPPEVLADYPELKGPSNVEPQVEGAPRAEVEGGGPARGQARSEAGGLQARAEKEVAPAPQAPEQAVAAKEPPASKQPWEMTRGDADKLLENGSMLAPDGTQIYLSETGGKSKAEVYHPQTKSFSTLAEWETGSDVPVVEISKSLSGNVEPTKKMTDSYPQHKWVSAKNAKYFVAPNPDGTINWERSGKISGLARGKVYVGGADAIKARHVVSANKDTPLPSYTEKQWKIAIQQALSEGKPIPPDILADYPDLRVSAAPQSPPDFSARNLTKQRATQIARETKGQVVPDPDSPKKWAVAKKQSSPRSPEALGNKPTADRPQEVQDAIDRLKAPKPLKFAYDPKEEAKRMKQTTDDLFTVGRHYFENGITKFSDWVDAMKKSAGEWAHARLSATWKRVNDWMNGQYTSKTPPEIFNAEKPVREPMLDKVVNAIKQAKPLRGQAEELKAAERRRRAGRMRGTLEKQGGESALGSMKRAMAGDYPNVAFEPIGNRFTQSERDALFDHIWTHDALKNREFEKARAAVTLQSVLDHGALPTRGEIALFEKIFGPKVASALMGKRGFGTRAWDIAQEIMNIPRTLVSSYDLSATLRQGFMLATSHPQKAAQAFKAQLKAFGNRDYAIAMDSELRSGEKGKIREKAGLDMPSVEGYATEFGEREEAFMSRLFQRITHVEGKGKVAKAILAPVKLQAQGIEASERAYITYLNKLRADVFDGISADMEASGMPEAQLNEERKKLAKFINAATGRGNVKTNPVANALFFSPKFLVSRFEYAGRAALNAIKSGATSKEAVRQLVAQAFLYSSLYTLGKVASDAFDWDTEFGVDPRSADFLKIRDKNTRVDISGGMGPVYRLIARIVSGQTVDSKGKVKPTEAGGEVGRFLRGKLSPVPSAAVSLAQGKDIVGKEYGVGDAAAQLTLPINFQNIPSYINEHGAAGLGLMIPDLLGLGVNVYEPKEKARKDPFAPKIPKPPSPPEPKFK